MRKQPIRPNNIKCVDCGVSAEKNLDDGRRGVVERETKKAEEADEIVMDNAEWEEEDEARKARPYNNPNNPTRQEVLKHELTH